VDEAIYLYSTKIDELRKKEMGDKMTKKEEYELKTEKLLAPIMLKNTFELVDVEYVKEGGNYFLRAYIDKEGGITVDDCELVSRELSDLLDQHDFIPDAYILEVSSPGLGRQLKKDKDFARSIEEEVEVKLYKAINKQKEYTGILKSFDSENITIEISEDTNLEIPRSNIALIRLALDF
jgi:ribosome maturation factor RimP